MTSNDDLQANLEQAGELLAAAAGQKAGFALLPENFAFIGRRETDRGALREQPGSGPIQHWLAEAARRHRLWLAAGTVPIAASTPDKVYGSQLLYDPLGRCTARYDKVHLFDVQIGTGKEDIYRESAALEAGNAVVVTETPIAKIGMSICYDLRFPELYRRMHQEQAELITAPSAFTATTGAAHWHVLVRARAIENLCYLIAANQSGPHPHGRSSYGHSLIVDPWGETLAEAGEGSGVICAEMDLDRQAELRRRFPVLQHRRPECTA